MASRGLRETATGLERVTDSEEAFAIRYQARRIILRSLLATIVVTGIVALLS